MGMNGASRWPRCIECGREILTLRKQSPVAGAPIKCRKCYGEDYYRRRGAGPYSGSLGGSVQAVAEGAEAMASSGD